MRVADLESMNINDLRTLARERGIETTKKAEIIQYLAEDAPQLAEQESVGTSASLIENAITHLMKTNQPSKESIRELMQEVVGELNLSVPASSNGVAPQVTGATETAIHWSEVPKATCDVNGEYIRPPWWNEFVSASQVSHIELKGSAGSGKTLAVHKLAEELGKKLAVVTADGGLRKRDLIGQREIANGTTYFDAGEFASSAKNGDFAIIDECNFADPDSIGFLNGLTDRAGTTGSTFTIGGKVIEVHPEFRCFLTRNPGYAGTKNMNEALKDRFWTIEVPPLVDDDLVQMFLSHGMDRTWATDSGYMVSALYKTWENNQINYQVSPRRALVASQLAERLGNDRKEFRNLLKKSILTKIESKHDKDAVGFQIETIWDTLKTLERSRKNG